VSVQFVWGDHETGARLLDFTPHGEVKIHDESHRDWNTDVARSIAKRPRSLNAGFVFGGGQRSDHVVHEGTDGYAEPEQSNASCTQRTPVTPISLLLAALQVLQRLVGRPRKRRDVKANRVRTWPRVLEGASATRHLLRTTFAQPVQLDG
jgi:hypothetical protein